MSRFHIHSYPVYRTVCCGKTDGKYPSKSHWGSAYYMFVVDYQKPRGRRKWPHWFRIMVTDHDLEFFKEMLDEYQQSSGVTLESFREFLARSVSRYTPVARGMFQHQEWDVLKKWEIEYKNRQEE